MPPVIPPAIPTVRPTVIPPVIPQVRPEIELLKFIKDYVNNKKAFNAYFYNRENNPGRLNKITHNLNLYGDAALEILNSDNLDPEIINNIRDPDLNQNGTYALLLYIMQSGHTDMMELYPTFINPYVTDDMLIDIARQMYEEHEDINLAVRKDYAGNQYIEKFNGAIRDMIDYPENFPNVKTYFDKKFPIAEDFSREDSDMLVLLMNKYYTMNKKYRDMDRMASITKKGRYLEYILKFYKNTIISILNNPAFDLTLIDQIDKDNLVLDMTMSALDSHNEDILNAYLKLTNSYFPDDIFAKIKEKSDNRENNQYDRYLLNGSVMKNLEKKLKPMMVSNVAVAVRNLRNKNVFNGYNEDKTIKTVGVPDNIQADILSFLYGDEESDKKSRDKVAQQINEGEQTNDENEQSKNKKKSFIKIQSSNPKQHETVLSDALKNIQTMPPREKSPPNNSSSNALAKGKRRTRRRRTKRTRTKRRRTNRRRK
jgi:hypothetical protein